MNPMDTFNKMRWYIYCWLTKGELPFEAKVKQTPENHVFPFNDMRWTEFTTSHVRFTPIPGTEEYSRYYDDLGKTVRIKVMEEIDLNGDLKRLGEVLDALIERDPREYIKRVRKLGIEVESLDILECIT